MKWINNTISNEKYSLSLKCFNDNNDLRLDKKAEKECYSHPAVFIRNETFPWRIQSPLKQGNMSGNDLNFIKISVHVFSQLLILIFRVEEK